MSSTAKPKAAPKREMSYLQMVLETFRDEKLRRGGTKNAVQKSCFSRFNIESTKSANNHFTAALKKQIAAGKISAINNKTKEASDSMGPIMRFKMTPAAKKELLNPPKAPAVRGRPSKAAAKKSEARKTAAAKKGKGRPKKSEAAAKGTKKSAAKPRPSAKSPTKVAKKAKKPTAAAKKVAKKQVAKKK